MRNHIAFVITIVSLPALILSCKKNDYGRVNPGPLDLSKPADPPQSLSYSVNNNEDLNLSFNYSELPGKVSVYYDDTTTENKFDHLFASYTFNAGGYLVENAFYNITGDMKSNITIQRENNIIKSIVVKEGEPGGNVKGTFQVSFADSTGATDYKLMHVDYGNYFENIPVIMDFVYHNNDIKRSSAGIYMSGNNTIFFPSFTYEYDNMKRLTTKESDIYYGANFMYDESGKGLDSLFRLLGGKDWYYLENILNYDENTSIFFYPLYITLSKGNVEIDVYMHRYGALSDVSSVPGGADYNDIEIFNFQNSFDAGYKLTKTTIFNGGEEYASYQFKY
ncbi:MAG: hypothetical protein IT249_12745 [Chitinophagaceae bacterium]|nr:hypothetical protein [Chitinophagaceae bacterium]